MAGASPSRPPAEVPAGPDRIPVGLDVTGWPCVVVGAGPVGTRRALALAAAGARVLVVAPEATADLRAAADAGVLAWRPRPLDADDLAGARIVVAAADDPGVNHRAAVAAPPGALVSRADDARAGDLTFAATVRRGPLRVAVDTGGRAPAVAAWAAGRVGAVLDEALGLGPDGLALLVGLVEEVRADGTPVTGGVRDWRSALERSMLDDVLLDLIRAGRRDRAKERLLACLSSS